MLSILFGGDILSCFKGNGLMPFYLKIREIRRWLQEKIKK